MATAEEVNSQIVAQGNLVRELKAKKADKVEIKEAVDKLLKLKADFKSACGIDWKPGVTVPSDNTAVKENTPPADDVNEKIKAQGDKVRGLKANKASKDEIKAAVDALLALKAEYKSTTGKDWSPEGQNNKAATPSKNVGETVTFKENLSENDANVLKNAASEGLDIKIKACGDLIRSLKLEKAEKEVIDQQVKVLLLLKNLYKEKTGKDWKPEAAPPKQSKAPQTQTSNEG